MPENRLIHEKSPHLLQHAHQPVDWYPWGEEAFEKARDEGKPIFLSIGYATCHFCEQMAKESFNDPAVAKEMNAVFVSIKVDREELPEIDTLYMEFAEALMSKQVGWPLNIILTPELKPFYAVSYLPPEPRHEVMSFRELIHHIDQLWHSEEKELLFDQANRLVDLFEKSAPIRGEEAATEETLEEAIDALYALADPVHGGMGGAPKFPLGYQLTFLLSRATLQNDARPLFLAKRTLDKMAQGGIYDHVGGGFFRYSVDEKWHVPHFEKTIADQALLAAAYLEGWQAAKDPSYKAVCQQILDFSLNEMHRPDGGFYAAEEGELDGSHLLWTKEEIAAL
ncbi:MAG: thioredoxin domain-containing protein, partial [Chlamydiia bacterium]|nr:thioredoxin domain-containing protein [Chlamydiia bacterium]